ncbi:uncharacterized protein LOC115441373 isoform X1 [Manduca sexta]|uniref:Uncharacterized protein n=1 Tax=Manduca sexta TaxID=7130 RepID=A0A922CI69_MANSE|nr:uncharacterized protein LOC115441373 isoform X1 [Manduca sexta]KAG6446823.1 hypothetical protein O3G_MSEX004618 [Manduca sexta]KAG6446824.1 hypothetical protein O3G_MSEX004618 [Manduca sexta]
MAPLELDGDNLGKKHQQYNRLLKEALTKKKITLTPNFKENGDIENLLEIDVACTNKNVNFILEVLKCEDMLYVSRAVKRSTWLVTEPEYAHIINIDYLKINLFPYMTTRAINKFMLSIRLHIKDEKKAEEFFDYEEKKNLDKALKWLPNCSLPFIEQTVTKHKDSISKDLLKRLCERSISVLEIYVKNKDYVYADTLTSTLFLIHKDAKRYLDVVEKLDYYQIPPFGRKYSEILMKVCPQKILDNFEKFSNRIDYGICAKYMKKEDIKPFLLKQASNEKMNYFLKYDNVKHFLKHMPKEGRFEFIKQLFIHNEKPDTFEREESDFVAMCASTSCGWTSPKNVYDWYRFAPFDTAFRDLKKLIRAESSPDERNSMLTILLYCAGKNNKNIHTLLQYYYEKHINEPFKFKIKFIEKVLKNVDVIKNEEIWLIVNRLFHSMEVYIQSTNNVEKCIEIIIIYNAINDKANSKIVEEKFSFNTLKAYRNKLQPAEQEKVFKYLYNNLQDKINGKSITTELCLNEVVKLIKKLLDLLDHWEKKLIDYPFIVNKIKEIIALKKEKSWNSKLSILYHVNKTWRKYLFEESVLLSPSESVCINALKHDPSLLPRHKEEINKLCCNDSVSLRIFLNKLRVYWPLSLTAEWTNFYFQQLDNPSKHKAAIRALMIILPQEQLKEFIRKYTPEDTKIKWGETDELNLSLRKYVAKKMYLSRPLLPAEMVLLYAKGDYLQYCIPSLNSILSNMSSDQSSLIVQKLLIAPVSLQKYGIRLAFSKLESKELKPLFSEAWKSTTNSTIRAVLFEKTHNALCSKSNIAMSEEMWELLSDFIDNLSHKENKKIYHLLGEVTKVPYNVRGKYYMKSYTFLKSMPVEDYIENIIKKLINIVPHIMEQLDTEFIAEVMLKDVDETFNKSKCKFLDVITTNALFCKDEETQMRNYERILAPFLDRHLPAWNFKYDNKKCVLYNFENLLKSFATNLKDVFLDRNKVIPVKLFQNILNKLENSLSVEENYVYITTWKLLTSFTELVNTHRSSLAYVEIDETDDIKTHVSYNRQKYIQEKWDEFFTSIIPSFAKVCTDNLQIDLKKYFPSIYILYGQAVANILSNFEQYYKQYLLYKLMLTNDKSNENYLLVLNYCSIYAVEEQKPILNEIRSLLESHPSSEIKIHCIDKFNVLDISDIL